MSDQSLEAFPASAIPAAETLARPLPVAKKQANILGGFARYRENLGVAAIYVFLGAMAIFAVFPIYYVVQASLNPAQSLVSTELRLFPQNISFSNYQFVFQQEPFLRWMLNSIEACGVATIVALICATSGAYALSRFSFPGRRFGLVGLMMLQTFPGLLAVYAYYQILTTLHLDGQILGLSVVYAAGNIVIGVWNIKGYFDTIPTEMEQAAMVDGANSFIAFFRIVLPLAAPAIAASSLLMFIGGWNEYVLASLILNPDPQSLTVPVGLFKLQSDQYTPWGYFAASAVVVSLPLTLLFLYLQRFFKSGLTIGGVKG